MQNPSALSGSTSIRTAYICRSDRRDYHPTYLTRLAALRSR